jgi:putative toxin-antitoxin system antitoxin component (TIGR02293 family)
LANRRLVKTLLHFCRSYAIVTKSRIKVAIWHNVFSGTVNSNYQKYMAPHLLTVESLLGKFVPGDMPRSPIDWVSVIRDGLPVTVIDAVTKATHLTQAELVKSLGMAERTILRRKRESMSNPDTKLTPEETSKMLRFARIAERASQTFEDDELALDWLRQPNNALSGNRPLDLLDTDLGAEFVADTLGRIEHGVFA